MENHRGNTGDSTFHRILTYPEFSLTFPRSFHNAILNTYDEIYGGSLLQALREKYAEA